MFVQKHGFRAEMVGRGIKVFDESGREVKVDFGATLDKFTVTAYVGGVGFIGGWTAGSGPHPKRKKAPEWSRLADSINAGIVYPDMNYLPPSYGRERAEQKRFREAVNCERYLGGF